MGVHAYLWWRCWGLVAVLGVCAAVVLLSRSEVLVILALTAFLAGLGHVLLRSESRRPAADARPAWPAELGFAAKAAPLGVALGGAAALSLPLMLLLVGCAAASSPWAATLVRSRVRSRRVVPTTPSTSEAGPDDGLLEALAHDVDEACVGSLSTAELCLAWRQSYARLQEVRTARLRAVVVASRRAYLDEMIRRDPSGLDAWLTSGARAASGPERFLHDPTG